MVNTVALPLGVGVMLVGVNMQVVPRKLGGRFVRSQDRVTLEGVPLVMVATIVVEPEPPGESLTPPMFESV
jgi:hypothetical protein